MTITRRQSVIGILALLLATAMSAIMIDLVTSAPINTVLFISDVAVSLGSLVLIFLYLRGYDQVRYIVIISITLLAGFSMPEPFVTKTATAAFYVPAVLAMILAEPIWMIGSSVTLLAILLTRANFQGAYTDPFTLLIFILTLGGMFVAHLVTRSAQFDAQRNNERIEQQKNDLAAQAIALGSANERQQEQLEQQRQLLSLVETLETTAVSIANDVLLAPLVGHMDTRRAQTLSHYLLQQAAERRSKLIILDIAGVSTMDTTVAGALVNIAQALRLLGCEVIISGISAEVAMTLTQLNITLPVRTVRSPQEALTAYTTFNKAVMN